MKLYILQNKSDFNELVNLSNHSLVILYFTASWCGPCKKTSLAFDNIPNDYDSKAFVTKIDVDDFNDIANKFDITTLPTIIFIKHSSIKEKLTGLSNKENLMMLIDKYLYQQQEEEED